MKNLKEDGITLVALITTVIILLILAFVIIGTVSGKGGLFGKFKQFLGIKTNEQNEQKYAIKQLEKTVNRFDIISDSNSNIR